MTLPTEPDAPETRTAEPRTAEPDATEPRTAGQTAHLADAEPDAATTALLERRQGRPGGQLAERMGIEFLKLSAEHSIARMPAEGNLQPVGYVHGGAYCVIAETLGSVSANIHAGEGRYAVGTDINATHTRSIASGWVTAECRAVHLGRSMTVHEVVCTDDEGKRASTLRITNFIKSR